MQLSGMALNRALPFAAFSFVVASAASMGIPGFSGFAAEITILIGTWKNYPQAVWITGIGMVLVAAFTLRALKTAFFGDKVPAAVESPALAPITTPEKLGAGLLMFSTLAIGIYPQFLLDRIMPAVEAMNFLKP
jgi:NADH-quinone oxidoreductase subunit M